MPLPPKACTHCNRMQPCPVHKKAWRNTTPYSSETRRKMKKVRERAKQNGWKCWKCGRVDPKGQVDHKTNRAEGGDDSLLNLWWLCTPCHRAKTEAERIRGMARRWRK